MSENLRLYTFPAPSGWSLISLSGRDAGDFLHRLTTVDIRGLSKDRGSEGFLLEPKGRILAAFTLWKLSDTEFVLEFDAGKDSKWRDHLVETIERYHFGEDLAISEVSSLGKLQCLWIFASTRDPLDLATVRPFHTAAIDDEIRLSHHGQARFGRSWITAWGRPERLSQWADRALEGSENISAGEIESWRIDSLGASVDHEITTEVNPLEIGLRGGVAEQKGCYPGQEVLEKILALGAPARRLVKLEGSGPAPSSGASVFNLAQPPVEVGTVTSAFDRGDGTAAALAIVRKIHAKPGFEVRVESGFKARVTAIAPYETPGGEKKS